MQTNRLEAFSDGVLAIIITIMVLELKVPHGEDVAAVLPDPLFVKTTHLSEAGARAYTGLLAGQLKAGRR